MRLLCFANAGSAESIYTGAVIKQGKRTQSALLTWAQENQIEVLAIQLPGREKRRKEPFLKTPKDAAAALFPIIASELSGGVPYTIVAHSVGTWVAYEFLHLLRERNVNLPIHCYFSCFPAPDIAVSDRPWTANAGMSDPDFQEECRGWDVNQVVFSKQMWELYAGMLRADFGLFDTYVHEHAGAPPFDFPISTFFAKDDRRVTRQHVEGWRRFSTSADFSTSQVEGHHLFVYNPDQKAAWFAQIFKSATAQLSSHLNTTTLPAAEPAAADPAAFKLWFPNRTIASESSPRMRVFCFSCAGGSETLFTVCTPFCFCLLFLGPRSRIHWHVFWAHAAASFPPRQSSLVLFFLLASVSPLCILFFLKYSFHAKKQPRAISLQQATSLQRATTNTVIFLPLTVFVVFSCFIMSGFSIRLL
jgi:surfactin synthase thioesterase subunit